jgi:hypothetical protein
VGATLFSSDEIFLPNMKDRKNANTPLNVFPFDFEVDLIQPTQIVFHLLLPTTRVRWSQVLTISTA